MKRDGVHRVAWASRPPYCASRAIHSDTAGEPNAWDPPPGAARDARHGRRDAYPTRDMPSRSLSGYLCEMVLVVNAQIERRSARSTFTPASTSRLSRPVVGLKTAKGTPPSVAKLEAVVLRSAYGAG